MAHTLCKQKRSWREGSVGADQRAGGKFLGLATLPHHTLSAAAGSDAEQARVTDTSARIDFKRGVKCVGPASNIDEKGAGRMDRQVGRGGDNGAPGIRHQGKGHARRGRIGQQTGSQFRAGIARRRRKRTLVFLFHHNFP